MPDFTLIEPDSIFGPRWAPMCSQLSPHPLIGLERVGSMQERKVRERVGRKGYGQRES